jgi:spermidine/putrescine transport system substrate-binding protein
LKILEAKESPTMDAIPQERRARQAGLRVVLAVLVLAAAAMVFGGCSKKEKLYIYNWTYYTPDSVIEKFEKEYNVRVVYDEFASNEDMFAKLKAGGSGYDIVFPSADYVSIMISQNMLEKIDKSKIPNLVNIDPAVLAQTDYDPNMEYSVPYYFGAAGILVNKSKVPSFEESWSIFAREDLKGRMTMLDDMREVMGDALAYLGYSVNTVDPAQIIEARNLVNNSWKPNLVKFDAEAFGKGYANGDFWVVQGYPEVVFEEILDNQQLWDDTYFFIPKEGGPAYIDSMCILKGAKNVDLAHKFINFIHKPEIYAEFCDIFGFPATANVPARNHKTGDAWYSEDELANVELKKDIGDALELYNNAWFNSIRVGE